MKNKGLIIALIVILAIGAIFFWRADQIAQLEEEVFCTQDAMQCPDGSYVGRVAPNCNFAPCPTGSELPPEPLFEDGTLPSTENMSIEGTATSSLDQDMVE